MSTNSTIFSACFSLSALVSQAAPAAPRSAIRKRGHHRRRRWVRHCGAIGIVQTVHAKGAIVGAVVAAAAARSSAIRWIMQAKELKQNIRVAVLSAWVKASR